MMNHLKQHLKIWHCKHFVIWGFSMDKWGFIKDQFLILGQLRKDIYGALMMCRDLPAHQMDISPYLSDEQKVGNKTLHTKCTQSF